MLDFLHWNFRHWSDGGSVYIISDLEFDNPDCKRMHRNWPTPLKHIEIINKTCHKNDTLIVLGDVGNPKYLDMINARIVVFEGNHDVDIRRRIKEKVWEYYTGPQFIADKILLSHEVIYGLTFCVNIHGHNHSGVMEYIDKFGAKHINLASNVCGWIPINLGDWVKLKGILSDIDTIHRQTIDVATNRVRKREGKAPLVKREKPKPVQQVAMPKDPNKKLRKMCDSYCVNCPKKTNSDEKMYEIGGCADFHNQCVIIRNKTQNSIRGIVQITEEYNPKTFREKFYETHEKLDGDIFIFCDSCPAMMAVLKG